jgi:MFS family permease
MHIYTVLAIQFFNHTCFRGSKVLLTLFAIELGASPTTAGVLFAMYSFFPTLIAIYAGRFADRFGYRIPMLFGTSGMAIGLALPFFWPTLTALFCSATLAGSCYIFYTVSVQSLVGSLGSGTERTRNYAHYALCVSITALTGPLIAGFGLEYLGGDRAYLLMALIPFVAIVLLLCLTSPITTGRARTPSARESSTASHPAQRSSMFANPQLRRIFIIAGVVETANELGNFLLPVYGTQIGLSPSEIGIVMSMLAVALFIVRALVPRTTARWGEIRVLGASLMVAAGASILMPLFDTFVSVTVVAFLLGLGIGAGAPLSMSLVYARAPRDRAGEAMGIRQTVNKGTEMVIPLIFGAMSTAFGMLPVFWATAVLLAAGGLLAPREPPPTAADAPQGR